MTAMRRRRPINSLALGSPGLTWSAVARRRQTVLRASSRLPAKAVHQPPLPHALTTWPAVHRPYSGCTHQHCAHYRHSAIACSRHRGLARGFLPQGLSNTCPQTGAMRRVVSMRGQVSNKPKRNRSLATLFSGRLGRGRLFDEAASGRPDAWSHVAVRLVLHESVGLITTASALAIAG